MCIRICRFLSRCAVPIQMRRSYPQAASAKQGRGATPRTWARRPAPGPQPPLRPILPSQHSDVTLRPQRCLPLTPKGRGPTWEPRPRAKNRSGEGQRLVAGVVHCPCLLTSESARLCQLRRCTRSRGTRAGVYLLKTQKILGRHASDGVEMWSGSIENLDIVNVVDAAQIKLEC